MSKSKNPFSSTRSNRLGDLLPLVPEIVPAISSTKPGMASVVEG
jgi:hypothetical protein